MAQPATPQPQTSPSIKKPDPFGKSYTFRLRQHNGGNFGGLWELCMLGSRGEIKKQITDADALPYCFENLMGELENDGF